jgi:hypothetical protein
MHLTSKHITLTPIGAQVWRPGATLSDIVRIKEINLDSNVLCLSRYAHTNQA